MKAARRFLAVIAVALGMAGAPAAEAYEMVMIKDIVTRFRQIPGVADDPEAKAAARLLAERLLGRWEEVRRGVLQRVVPVSHTLVIEPL